MWSYIIQYISTQMFVVIFTLTGVLDTTFAFPNEFLFITASIFSASYPLNTLTECRLESVKIDTVTNPNKIIIDCSARGVIPFMYLLPMLLQW